MGWGRWEGRRGRRRDVWEGERICGLRWLVGMTSGFLGVSGDLRIVYGKKGQFENWIRI